MKIKGIKQEYGITIVSLVVTIIVLIILAGISISLLFGKSGIITRAKKGQEIADVATAQEKLELIKSEIPIKILEGKDSTVNLNNYLEELNKDKNKKDCDVTNIEKLNDINAEIMVSGKYKFLAKDEENGNVKIIYLGEAGGLQIAPTEATYRYPTAGTFEVINNESQGKLTVKSSNEEIAKASISGTTVTVTPQKMAGTAKIVVTSEANGEYAEGRVTHTAKVENGTILLDAEPYIAEYDGKAHDALISVTVDPKDCKLEYSLNGGKFTEVMPKVTMAADEYTISIKASKEGYTTNAITKTVTINKQSNTNGNLTLSATSGTITYPNNGTFTVTKNTSGGTLSVSSSDTSIATASISGTTVTITPKVPTTDGKKTTITVTSAATSNYEAQTATYVATVNMGKITINATAYNGKYDGKAHNALTTVSTDPTGTTIEYSLNGGTYSTTMPQVNSTGTYSIAIKASKTGYVTANTTITLKIECITIEELRGKNYVEDDIIAKDSNKNFVKIPKGFKVAEDSGINVTEGIVIEDNDKIEGIGNNRGNQYVWIPVGNGIKKSDGTSVNITLGRYRFANGTSDDKDENGTVLTKGTPILKQSAENYTQEVLINSYYEELETYRQGVASFDLDGLNTTSRGKKKADGTYEGIKSFIDSVKANGGYYIARYEASYGTDGKANSKVSNTYTDTSTAPTTRTEGMLWNHITQIDAAKACYDIYTTATTDLVNSYAWDTAIVYIQEFSDDTDYSRQTGQSINSSLTNTGANKDEKCKINDMASNEHEWTTEYSNVTTSYYSSSCTNRGGVFDFNYEHTSYRIHRPATYEGSKISFRSTLYM